jgi:hypothetical protein
MDNGHGRGGVEDSLAASDCCVIAAFSEQVPVHQLEPLLSALQRPEMGGLLLISCTQKSQELSTFSKI